MKKYILIILIMTIFVPAAFSATVIKSVEDNQYIENMQELEDVEKFFYEAPVKYVPPAVEEEDEGSKMYPLFKQVRIKLTNYSREKRYEREQKFLQKQKLKQQNKLQKFFAKFYDDTDDYIYEDEELQEETVTETSQQEVKEAESSDSLKLQGGVKEQITSKDAQLDADKIEFDNETMDIIATGSPVLYFPPQKTKIKAKKMIYNHASNILKAIDNVEVTKNGQKIKTDYLEINMNEERAFMDNVHTNSQFLTVNSRKGEMDEKQITLYDGEMLSEKSFLLRAETTMIGGHDFKKMVVPEGEESYLTDTIGDTAVHIDADEVIVDAKKNNDTITLKQADITYGDFHLFKMPSLTIHTNKNHDYFEANYPEFGSRANLGMFAGPGFVFDTPLQGGSTIKAIPIVNGGRGFGLGALLKYRSGTNFTNFGYGSSYGKFVLNGRQNLDDHLYLQYGMNSYSDEWFLGHRMPKYNAELVYRDQTKVKSTLADNLDLNFEHRASVGYMHNRDENSKGEHYKKGDIGTVRMRYMAQAIQDLYKYEDLANGKFFRVNLRLQGSAAVYGTGDTQFVGRIGPGIESQYKRWFQTVRYYASAYDDNTPMARYDKYRYGRSSVYVREAFRVNKYLTLGWYGYFSLLGDTPNGELLQENTFIIMLGPDDFKVHFGYDFQREQTYFACVIALDTKGSSLKYNKMVIKNPDRLTSDDSRKVKLKVFDNTDERLTEVKPKKRMMYAEVIDIEDPDKEHI